jgi:hypothetical protein
MAQSDKRDSTVWQANHDVWAKLVSAELAARKGKAPKGYTELIEWLKKRGL